MTYTKCHNCKNKVPVRGQCNKCGFVNGVQRMPTQDEFMEARKINERHEYEQYDSIDMRLMEIENSSQ